MRTTDGDAPGAPRSTASAAAVDQRALAVDCPLAAMNASRHHSGPRSRMSRSKIHCGPSAPVADRVRGCRPSRQSSMRWRSADSLSDSTSALLQNA